MKQLTDTYSWPLVMLMAALVTLGQLQRVQISQSLAVYGHEIVLIILILWWLATETPRLFMSQLIAWGKEHRWWLMLFVWIIGGLGLATLRLGVVTQWLYLGRITVYALFTWLLFKKFPVITIFGRSMSVLYGYLAVGLVTAYFGFLQYVLIPDTRFLYSLGWDDHYYRLLGTQFDPAFMGMLLVFTFFLTEIIKKKNWGRLLRCILVLAISLTFSRATYLALIMGISVEVLVAAYRHQRLWSRFMFIPFLLLCIFAIPRPGGEGVNLTRTSTIVSRMTASEAAVMTLEPWEWLGGRGLFVPYQSSNTLLSQAQLNDHANQPDNLLVLLTTGLGVGGCALLCGALWSSRKQIAFLPTWVLANVVAVLSHSLVNNTLFQPFVWLMILGILIGGQQTKATRV